MAINKNHTVTSRWNSRTGFLFAAVGGAVGLGNLWRFPFEVGQNGGAAFVLIYIAFVFIIGLPLLSTEILMGRISKQGAITCFGHIAKSEGKSNSWRFIGWFISATAFIICAYYSVVVGTTAAYTFEAISGNLNDITPQAAIELNKSYETSAFKSSFWHGMMMIACAGILSRNFNDGIEKTTSIMMPLFFLLLIALIILAAIIGDFSAGLKFLFEPDFSKISLEMIISALGQAFFSISVAVGILLTFGAYLPNDISIIKSAFIICLADTMVAIFAGLCIFPIVFGFGLEPDVGSALVFNTMTVAFGQLEYGGFVAVAFFSLLSIAGLTTLLALMEQFIVYLTKFYNIKRKKAALIVSGAIFVFGLPSAFSTNILSSVKVLDMTFIELSDWWASFVGLPLGGLAIAVFAGWVIKKDHVVQAFGIQEKYVNQIYLLVRYICPIAIFVILISQFL